jgi:hypothetical protein
LVNKIRETILDNEKIITDKKIFLLQFKDDSNNYNLEIET